MKACPDCGNLIKRSKKKCPFCGYIYPAYEFFFSAVWRVLIVIFLVVIAAYLIVNIWDFKLI